MHIITPASPMFYDLITCPQNEIIRRVRDEITLNVVLIEVIINSCPFIDNMWVLYTYSD